MDFLDGMWIWGEVRAYGFGYVSFHQLFNDLEIIIGIGLRMISQIDLFASSNWIFPRSNKGY